VLLKDSYEALGELDKAVAASQRACRLKPCDGELADEYQRLSAELTVASGKYDQEGDFRHSIKDREGQEKLQAQESVIKTEDYRFSAVEEAREAMAQDPNLPKNIFNLAEALSDLRNDKAENEAIKLLEDTYKTKRDFSFKQRAGQLRIKHLKRKIKEAETALATKAGDAQAKSKAAELSAQLNDTELGHYRICVENYPTDLRAKYEYGVRLVRYKKYDEAIPLFQEAQRDPRHKISAMDKIGFCFFMKGWFTDAIDVFTRAIEAYEIKDDSIAKELRYNLARSYQEQGNTEKALEIYRKIAQLDFAYKDIRQQIDKLRGKKTEPTSQ
jgi:tetratricopeptide (TPR) repeat protein